MLVFDKVTTYPDDVLLQLQKHELMKTYVVCSSILNSSLNNAVSMLNSSLTKNVSILNVALTNFFSILNSVFYLNTQKWGLVAKLLFFLLSIFLCRTSKYSFVH